MTSINQNFTIWQGEDVEITAPVTDGSGVAVSLTGATAVLWRVYDSLAAAAVTLSKTLGGGITLANSAAVDDAVVITVDSADTAGVAPGRYYHECRVTDASGDEQVIFVGNLVLKRSKTN